MKPSSVPDGLNPPRRFDEPVPLPASVAVCRSGLRAVLCLGVVMAASGLPVTSAADAPIIPAPSLEAAPSTPIQPSALPELRASVQHVLLNHPEIGRAEAESRQADWHWLEARQTRWWPQVSADAAMARSAQDLRLTDRTANYQQRWAQLRASMPLYDPAQDAKVAVTAAGSRAADWRLSDVRDQVLVRTVELYGELWRQARLTELARENLRTHRQFVSQMKELARVDVGRAGDLPIAQARVALAESVLTSRLGRLEAARVQWTANTGLPSPDAQGDRSLLPLEVAPLPDTLEEAVEAALQASPALQKALADIVGARMGIESVRAGYQPRVSAELQARGGNDYGNVKGRQTDWYVGVEMNWKLGVGPVRSSATQAAGEAVTAAQHQRAALTLQLRASVEGQWFELHGGQSAAASFQTYVVNSKAVVENYRAQFKLGRRSLLDVLNAENELFTARSNLASAEVDLSLASWRLATLQGRGQASLGL